jgi:hypothetical protein
MKILGFLALFAILAICFVPNNKACNPVHETGPNQTFPRLCFQRGYFTYYKEHIELYIALTNLALPNLT